MFQRFLEYIEILRLMPRRSLLETLLWWIGFKPSAEICVGGNTLRLYTKMPFSKIIWYLKILSKAYKMGIHVVVSRELIRIKYGKISFMEPLSDYSFIKLHHIMLLHKHDFRVYHDKVIGLKDKIVLKYPFHDPYALGVVAETFVKHQWGFLNVRDHIVIDVGAYIGDSAIYFAKRGARKVICFEPHPLLFRYLVENVKLNGYEDIIECHNHAVSSSEGTVSLIVPEGVLLADSRVPEDLHNTRSLKVKAVKLPLEGDVLKMDCEGCEYEVLLNIEPRDLPFQEIGLEYHGSPKPLIKHLKRGGYAVKIVKHDTKRGIGLLHAYRKVG